MREDSGDLWARISQEIKTRIRPQQFETWFTKVAAFQEKPDELSIVVPSVFWRDWLKSHYMAAIKEAVRVVAGDAKVGFLVNPDVAGPTGARPEVEIETESGGAVSRVGEQLNARYTFGNFVVGPSNQFAHAAAMAVAESPSKAYNPLYVYGSVGMGKTHLVQAICHACVARHPRSRVIYTPCESFLNDYVGAIQSRKIDKFRAKYRQADLLIIDDIHFLANKERSQEEFFHTFNTLYNADRQIILSSDSAPNTIPAIEERLSSRFRWGLEVKIAAPVYETRATIVRKKAEMYGGGVPDDVVEYLASSANRNIRELEGAVIRVIGFASLTGRQSTVALAEEVLEERDSRRQSPLTMQSVMEIVTEAFGVRTSDLQSRKRTRSLARPRQVCMYLARKHTDLSLEEIGRHLGGRDHSTVVYAQDKIETEIKKDKSFRRTVEGLRARLNSL
jgi:chromosomal replication initiator protein